MSGDEKPQPGENSAPRDDRRKRHQERERAAGWTRCIVRCHVDDVSKVKAYAATLISRRKQSSNTG